MELKFSCYYYYYIFIGVNVVDSTGSNYDGYIIVRTDYLLDVFRLVYYFNSCLYFENKNILFIISATTIIPNIITNAVTDLVVVV